MNPYIRLLRPINCVMASLAVPVASFIMNQEFIQTKYIMVGIASIIVFLVTGGGNALNDYFDREVDKINHPDRPIPSGEISPKNALIFSLILFSASVVLAHLFLDSLTAIVVVLAIFLLGVYEGFTKRLGFVGNLNISALVGLIFIYAGFLSHEYIKSLFPFLLAFLSNVGREIAKDIEDVSGDIDRKTLPMKIGIIKAREVSSSFFLAAVALSPLPYFFSLFSIYYIPVVIVSDVIFVIAAITVFYNAGKAQRISKIAMVFGLLAFLAGGF